jgi:hypothetical protein
LLVCAALGSVDALATQATTSALPRNYRDLPATGKLSIVPYVWEREAHGKHLVVIGTRHSHDPNSPMFRRIEALFKRVRPQLVLHEGETPDDVAAAPRNQAIACCGDLGFAVHLAHRYGVPAPSGDAPVPGEIKMLLTQYPAADVFVFLTAQRLIGGARHPDLQAAAGQYPSFLANYLQRNGLPKQPAWSTWNDFLREYARVAGSPLSRETWSLDVISPIRDGGRLNQIARSSASYRDRYLLAAIRSALQEHDRVIVVFGGWHVLALEPVLQQALPR